MFVSETTVKSHVGNLMRKLMIGRRAEAVYTATKLGLLQPRDPDAAGRPSGALRCRPMRFYAERPVRFLLQLSADVLVIAWVVLCVNIAIAAHELIQRLQVAARTLSGAGDSIRTVFDDASRTAGQVPFVGEALAGALGAGTGAGTSLADAGRQQAEVINTVAVASAVGIVAVAALPIVVVWLVVRIRYARAARSAVRVRTVDSDLLALRAMTHLPVRRLLTVSPDPAAAWRRDDRDVVHRLAALELRGLGLRAPRTPPD